MLSKYKNIDKEIKKSAMESLKEPSMAEEDIRMYFDVEGNLTSIGSVSKDFKIYYARKHVVADLDSVDKKAIHAALNSNEIKNWLRYIDPIFKEMFENSFLLFYKPAPKLITNPDFLQQFYLFMLQNVMEQEEFFELVDKCNLDKVSSALAAKSLVEKIQELLSKEDLDFLKSLQAANDDMQQHMENLNEFMQGTAAGKAMQAACQGTGDGQGDGQGCGKRPMTPKEMGLNAQEARERLKKMQEQFGDMMDEINSNMEEHRERVHNHLKRAVKSATKQANNNVNTLHSILNSFGIQPGEYRKMDISEALLLSQRYQKEKRIKDLLDEIGRKSTSAKKIMKKVRKDAENQLRKPRSRGSKLELMTPNEMINAQHPKLKRDWKKRLVEDDLDIYDTTGPVAVAKGPIIVCIDTSGSMRGDKDTWAKGLAISMNLLAREQKRSVVLVLFGSPGEVFSYKFDHRTPPTEILDAAAHGFWHGTCYETPLAEALKHIESSEYSKADILFLTDGECNISSDFLKKFKKVKKEKEFKVVSILINLGYGTSRVLEQFSDKVILLSELQSDEDVLQTAYAL